MADVLTDLQQAPASDTAQGTGAIPAADQSQSDIWARIQDAVKRGLISSDQYQQMAAKMGYTPQNVAQTPTTQNGKLGGNFATGVKEPDYGNGGGGIPGQLGTAAGNIVGQVGKGLVKAGGAAYDAINSPGAPMDINPPSPAWNQ